MTKLGKVVLSALASLAVSYQRLVRANPEAKVGSPKPFKMNQRNASKSQRNDRNVWGHRDPKTVGARAQERRAKHAIKGTVK